MAMLSKEVNRFLGSALLDPSMLKCIFGGERAQVLQDFSLQPAERNAILASQARTLTELSRELIMSCAHRDVTAEREAILNRFYQSAHIGSKRASIHMETVAQRVIDTLPSQPSTADSVVAAEKFVKCQAVS